MSSRVTGTFAEGDLANGIFAEGIFAEQKFRRKEFSRNWNSVGRNLRRTEFKPSQISQNDIFAEHYDIKIPKVSFRIYTASFIVK